MRAPFASAFCFAVRGFALTGLTIACDDTTAPAVASQLGFAVQPATAVAGESIAPAVVVVVLDANGRTVTSARNHIDIEIVANPAHATLSGTTSVTAVNGTATFSNLTMSKVGVDYRLVAKSPGLSSPVSSPFDVKAGPPGQLAFVVQPTKTSVASTIDPAVLVEVRDASGNPVTSATNAITVAISGGGGGGSLSGTTTVAAVNGVATFSSLSVNTAGAGYTLTAAAANLVGATSAVFDIRDQLFFTTVSAGYFHACGVSSGVGYCWGEASDGQLGAIHDIWPGSVSGGFTFAQVSAGRVHTCGVTAAGAAYCWGSNFYGQLGTGSGSSNAAAPTAVFGGRTFAMLSAGYNHTCGVTTAGAGYCWGDNSTGELADPTIARSNVPLAVPGGLTFSTLSPGRYFTCGLTTDNAAYCWGDNSFGELGDGTTVERLSPVPVSGQLKFTVVSAGGFHACGLTTAGAAYCWGDDSYGELGDGFQSNSVTPTAVSGGYTFAMISAGNRHTCAVTTSGIAYCWGENSTGHLGNNSITSSKIPVAVSGGLTFANVSAGRFHTCGLTTAGAGYCWGQNGSGKLGDGTTTDSRVPVRIR